MKRFIFATAIFLFLLSGCDSENREEVLNEKVDSLNLRVDSLKNSLTNIKNSPEYLIGQAHRAYEKAEYEKVQELLWQIQKDYPEWNKYLVLEYLGQIAEIIDDKTEPPFKE